MIVATTLFVVEEPKMRNSSLVLAAAVVAAGVWTTGLAHEGEAHVHAKPAAAPVSNTASAGAVLVARSGSATKGKAHFVVEDGKVTMEIEMEGLTPGEHAIHLHDKGDCSAPDAMSAGGHWNPTGEDHGKWGHDPYHHGDIGNLVAGEDGKAELRFTTSIWTIGGGGKSDIVGRSVIVHAQPDDFKTQPTGNAGGRVACGVIVVD